MKCFISGLRDTIKNQVMMFQPTTLIQAIGLALPQANTMETMIKEAKSSSRITTSLLPRTQEIGRGTLRQIPQIKKISQVEMQDRTRGKKSYVTTVTKNMNLGISVKGDKFIYWKEMGDDEIRLLV